jgi:hypothetical protein
LESPPWTLYDKARRILPGLYLGDTRTAFDDVSNAGKLHYPIRVGESCQAVPFSTNHFSPASIAAHELLGHGFDGVSDNKDEDEAAAVVAENMYHAAASEAKPRLLFSRRSQIANSKAAS